MSEHNRLHVREHHDAGAFYPRVTYKPLTRPLVRKKIDMLHLLCIGLIPQQCGAGALHAKRHLQKITLTDRVGVDAAKQCFVALNGLWHQNSEKQDPAPGG